MLARFSVGYEQVCRAILTAFVINVAFIVHTVMGLVVAGLFPSVAAAYATWRTWIISEDHWWTCKETWTVFHRAWKSEFQQANIAGWPQLLLWLLLIYDYSVVNWHDAGVMGYLSSGVLLVVLVVYGAFSMLFWAIRANFDENIRWCVKMTLQMLLCRPLCTLCLLVGFLMTVMVWLTWPGVLLAFGLSLPVLVAVGCVYFFGRIPGLNVRDTEAWKARHPA
ncbi:YesL family protein [Bifidobacterium pullorum]|uniref:DUF624 domain-containing protein n=1 Tax=Bifidobacterium pullorum subsp. gallinarum TaxID=78344 RepID=A0A921IZF9_9BIFI|nr:DUF624 domain-containing protein [Bifidobacterium pullorum]HJG41611.1 DUF624 domain-containing protein [Bifidobacterium pullorum subsp. gallinarum]